MSAAAKAALSHIDTNSVAEETPMRNRDLRSQAEERITERRLAREGKVSVPGSAKARQALAYRKALDDYVSGTEPRRLAALTAKDGVTIDTAPDIRKALEQDLVDWGKAFGFDKTTMQDQRTQWLGGGDALSAADWARKRASWFVARDAWIEQQRAVIDKELAPQP